MPANLRKVEVPDNLYDFFKQMDPKATYLIKYDRSGYQAGDSGHYSWRTVRVVLDFKIQKFGLLREDGSMMPLRNDYDLEMNIKEMYEIDELFDMIAGDAK